MFAALTESEWLAVSQAKSEMRHGSDGSHNKRTHSEPSHQVFGTDFGGGKPERRPQIEQ